MEYYTIIGIMAAAVALAKLLAYCFGLGKNNASASEHWRAMFSEEEETGTN